MELWLRNWDFSRFRTSQPFRSCEMRVTVLRNGTRVPKSASQPRNPLRNGTFVAKSAFFTSQCVSQLRNRCSCAAKWHSCAKSGFRSCENFRREGPEAANWFHSKMPISQRLRNFADPCFSPVFAPFDSDFAPILLRKTSFNFFTIPLDFDHPKTYITSKQT